MSNRHHAAILEQEARIVPAPALAVPARRRHERAFDLHPGVHAMVIGAWFSFVGILVATFSGPDLMIPAVICFLGMASLFVTPALWARVKGDDGLKRQSWAAFLEEGVATYTGHLKARDALAQILILPVLLVGVALVFAVIRATV